MKTAKPISSVSWNTPSYLEQILEELLKGEVISFWCYICHKGEDDEGGKKDHIHLYVEPTKMIQTVKIRDCFKEPDPNNKKPLGCLDFNFSKWADWYLYGLHDEKYLTMKGLVKKYHYTPDCMAYSDEREFEFRVKTIAFDNRPIEKMKTYIRSGKTFNEMLMAGLIPTGNFTNMQKLYFALKSAMTANGDISLEPPSPLNDISPDLPFDGEISTGKINFPPTPF